jgi:DNA (cytosine-5)-methyltransferase 1
MGRGREWYEFFAGGGMARLGLGERWSCTFANEICEKKAASYGARFGDGGLRIADVAALTTADLPGTPVLAWASFPCQDLSLAGAGEGLNGGRSGTFKPFWKLMVALRAEGRAPKLVVLENVVGAITSNSGRDFQHLIRSLHNSGWRAGPSVIDSRHFLPQSRPRLFIVAVSTDSEVPDGLQAAVPNRLWHPPGLRMAFESLPASLQGSWVWWDLPTPTASTAGLSDLIEEKPIGVEWHTPEQTARLLSQMSASNIVKVRRAQQLRRRVIGTVYRRTRPDDAGEKVQRAEVRFDGVAGCLRTPVGGSSRQIVLFVEGGCVRSRLLSAREAAKLMGVDPSDYPIPANYNEAYHLFGDGVAVPVVRYLEQHLLYPLSTQPAKEKAA